MFLIDYFQEIYKTLNLGDRHKFTHIQWEISDEKITVEREVWSLEKFKSEMLELELDFEIHQKQTKALALTQKYLENDPRSWAILVSFCEEDKSEAPAFIALTTPHSCVPNVTKTRGFSRANALDYTEDEV